MAEAGNTAAALWGRSFEEFVFSEEIRPDLPHNHFAAEEDEIPFVDLDAADADLQLDFAARVGFLHLTNHGIDAALVGEMERLARQLFGLPREQKESVRIKQANTSSVGYIGSGGLYNLRFWFESFVVVDDPAVINQISQKLWPDSEELCTRFSAILQKYAASMRRLGFQLLQIFERVLGLQSGAILEYCKPQNSQIRINHYPPCENPFQTFGLPCHTDTRVLTLLHQDQVGGLQILKNGRWLGIKPRSDALLVNIGDALEALTNGCYKSVLHRVVTNATVPRLSMIYFVSPNSDATIAPTKQLVDAARPQKYRSFTWTEYREFVDSTRTDIKNLDKPYLDHFKIISCQ